MDQPQLKPSSPWLTASEAAAYVKFERRFIIREINAGRLRAARIGGRKQILTRADWLDSWIEGLAEPVEISPRRRG